MTEKNKMVEKVADKELPKPFTQQDLKNIQVIFEYAKKYTLDNDDNLFNVLIVKKDFINKLSKLIQ